MLLLEKDNRAKLYHTEGFLLWQDHFLRYGLCFASPVPDQEVVIPWVTYPRGRWSWEVNFTSCLW